MFKKLLSLFLAVIMIFTFIFSLSVSASAISVRGTQTGSMQDTSDPDNGIIYWSYSYDRTLGSAKLSIWGSGYMPNDTADSWFEIQNEAQCYITEVTIGEGIKSLMNNAFAYEVYLQKVTLPSTLEIIGDGAFAYTDIKTLRIPAKVKKLDGAMFSCSSIEEFTVDSANPYYVSANGDIYSKDMSVFTVSAPGKFKKSSGADFKFPSSVKTIAAKAFYMSPVDELIIPSNITEIKNMAFAGSALQNLHIDSGLQKIYDSAFLACDNLEELYLPSTINYLGYYSVGFVYELDYEGLEYTLNLTPGSLNKNNIEYYQNDLYNLGYTLDQFIYCAPDSGFTLFGYDSAVSQSYALMSGINFGEIVCDNARAYSAHNTEKGVLIKWIKSNNADGYKIMRQTELGKYEQIAIVNDNNTLNFTDTNPHEYFTNVYSVIAFNLNGDSNYDKNEVACDYVKSPVFSKISISNATNGIKLSWQYTGITDRVYIYRKDSSGNWIKIASSDENLNSYTDKSVKYGTKYTYKVQLVRDGAFSSPTTEASYTYIQAPANVKLKNTVGGVYITWNKCSGAKKYYVYRKKKGDKSWTRLAALESSTLSYKDASSKSGTQYIYTVRANNGSDRSAYLTSGKTILFLSTPKKGGIKSTRSGIQVKYTRSVGATGYYIYRKIGSSGWKRIATVKGNNVLSYTDKSAQKGKTYKYTVRAYKGSYKSSYYSSGQKIKDIY